MTNQEHIGLGVAKKWVAAWNRNDLEAVMSC